VGLVLVGIALALILNAARNVLLAFIAATGGIANMERWHDPAGWLILLVSLPPMFLLAGCLRGAPSSTASAQVERRIRWRPLPGFQAVVFGVWFIGIFAAVELWYRAHEPNVMVFRPLEFQWPNQQAHFQVNPIADRTRDVLLCSSIRSASWEEEDRARWIMTSVEWAPRQTSPQFARVHRPEVCLQATGMTLIRKMPAVRFGLKEGSLQFESLELRHDERPVYVFFTLYEGTNRDDVSQTDETAQSRVQRAIHGQRNAGQQMVEIQVAGYPSYEAAAEAFARRLPSLIRAEASGFLIGTSSMRLSP
jgi:hypothetical protein